MIAIELISKDTPTLKLSDTGQFVLDIMDTYRVSHLAVINNTEFLGVISDADIYNLNSLNEKIEKHPVSLFKPFVFAHQHLYEVLSVLSKLKLTALPVLNRDKSFAGTIKLPDLIQQIAELLSIGQVGSVIILELNQNDYSLSEIAQIVESNDAKILSLYVNTKKESTKLNVTIKINQIDLAAIIQTFERYNYDIKIAFSEEGKLDDLLEDRYDEFMRYLNV